MRREGSANPHRGALTSPTQSIRLSGRTTKPIETWAVFSQGRTAGPASRAAALIAPGREQNSTRKKGEAELRQRTNPDADATKSPGTQAIASNVGARKAGARRRRATIGRLSSRIHRLGIIAVTVITTIGATVASAAWGSTPAAASTKHKHKHLVTVTMNSSPIAVTDNWPQLFAYYDGIFKKYGLNVKLTTLSGAGASAAEAVQSGHLDFGLGSAEFATVDAAGGNQVSVFMDVQHYAFDLIANKSIASLKDLEGKTLAVAGLTGAFAVAGHILFKQDGIPMTTIHEVTVSSIANVLPAVENGSAAAGFVIYGPAVFQGEKAGLHVLASTATGIKKPVVGSNIAITKTYAKSHKAVVQDFVNASEDALKTMMDNENLTVKVMTKATPTLTATSVKEAWTFYKHHVWTLKTAPTVEEFNQVLPVLVTFDSNLSTVKAKTLVDDTFASKAIKLVGKHGK